MDPRPGFTADDLRVLRRICRTYDLAIFAAALIAAATGHLAGGLVIAAVGAVAFIAGEVIVRSGTTDGSTRKR